jgi:hypothetical protein
VDGVKVLTVGDSGLKVNIERLTNAAVIYSVGKANPDLTRDDVIMGLMTAMQESNLQNLGYLGKSNDHNSIGLFQQQFGMVVNGQEYWGTAEQLHDPYYSTNRFFKEMLRKVPNRASMSKNDVIQKIQVSGVPDAYGKWEDEATSLYDAFEQSAAKAPKLKEDKSVAVIGDSITVATNSYIFQDLAAAGYSVIHVDAQSSRSVSIDTTDTYVQTTSGTEPSLDPNKEVLISGISAIRRQRATGFDPKDWIILLGTNDIGLISNDPQKGAEDVRSLVGKIMDELGPDKRVMWLTVWSQTLPEKAKVFNDTITKMATERQHMLIGDWASLAEQHPGWFADSVHYTPEGNKHRSSFIGQVAGFFGDVIDTGSKIVSALNPISWLCGSDSLSSIFGSTAAVSGNPVTDTSKLARISNPELAQAASTLEQRVGGHILYGGARQKWYDQGRKGNFGHGNKEQWLSEIQLGEGYRSLDCSGLMNMALYLAYQVDYNGCSHNYMHLVIDGEVMTQIVQQHSINASLLQPGDFIIDSTLACGEGGHIGHIMMVLGTDGSKVITIESDAGKGVNIKQREATWFGTEWPDLVISRWVGKGAIELTTQPVNVGSS